jgi:hypothetical protein
MITIVIGLPTRDPPFAQRGPSAQQLVCIHASTTGGLRLAWRKSVGRLGRTDLETPATCIVGCASRGVFASQAG